MDKQHNPEDCRVCDVNGLMKKALSKPIQPKEIIPPSYHQCPPDYVELGNSSWTFLHSIAAYYPDKPNDQQKVKAKELVEATSVLYPCPSCASHMRKEIKKDPVVTEDAKQFSKWLCDFHNKVNKELGKPNFPCENIFKRWRDGFE